MAPVSLLETSGLCRSYGGLTALSDVDFALAEGEIHALIGPNGAGKTTLVNLLSGRQRSDSGKVLFLGQDITSLPAHKRVRLGIAYTFQITSIYPNLPVLENVALAALHGTGRHGSRIDTGLIAKEIVGRVGLTDQCMTRAGNLSYGHQRLVEVAMGIALSPRLLILDEPTQGLSNAEISLFSNLVKDISAEATILLIEHNMDVVMNLATQITVLESGRVLASGTRDDIRSDPAVQAAYLGG